MFDSIAKILGLPLLCVSITGLVFIKKQKLIPIAAVIIPLLLWRAFSRHSSSRYYSIFIFAGLFLSIYLIDRFIKHEKLKAAGIVIALGIFLYQLVKVYSSFSNVYVFDYLDSIRFLSDNTESSNSVFYEKKVGRSELVDQTENRNIMQYPVVGESGLFSLYCTLFSGENKVFVVTTKECSSLSAKDNPFQLKSEYEAFSKVGYYNTNTAKSKGLSIFNVSSAADRMFENESNLFLFSPNRITYSPESVMIVDGAVTRNDKSANSFEVTGNSIQVKSLYTLRISEKKCNVSAVVNNIGTIPVRIYLGYEVFSNDGVWFDGRNYPFTNSEQILTVVSAKVGDNKIIVDSYPEWGKNCHLALDAKEDLSDIPNTNLVEAKIVEINRLDDGQAEIILGTPLRRDYASGTKIRIHGKSGDYIYTNKLVLDPGEKKALTSEIAKDETCTQYTEKAFSKGVYYVRPVLLSYSVDRAIKNNISITDLNISF